MRLKPILSPLALAYIENGISKSGYANIRAVVNPSFNATKVLC